MVDKYELFKKGICPICNKFYTKETDPRHMISIFKCFHCPWTVEIPDKIFVLHPNLDLLTREVFEYIIEEKETVEKEEGSTIRVPLGIPKGLLGGRI